MCKLAIETELEKIFIEQSSFEEEYVSMLKEKFISNNKQIKRLILARFINNISDNQSLALFDEDIFNIYKTIIDNYIIFLNKEDTNFKFNDELSKNLSGITSVLKSQVSFFYDDKHIDINPIYTEKKTIIAKYIDNIYTRIDNLFDYNFDNINAKDKIIENIIKEVIISYKTNLLECFNAINDIENRKEVNYFNDTLQEEREILSSIIKVQIKALEDLCKDDNEKNNIKVLLKPIIEAYQQTGKSFEQLNNKIKNINTNINVVLDEDNKKIEEAILVIFKDIKSSEEKFRQKSLEIFKKYLLSLKDNIIINEKETINTLKNNIDKYLKLSNELKDMFSMLNKYINTNKDSYKKNELYNIIDGINESVIIKIDNINEKEAEVFEGKDQLYKDLDNALKDIENYNIQYDFDSIYTTLKNDFNMENIKQYINAKPMLSIIEKISNSYIKKVDDFIKNTLLFEISTFQEIIYYSVVRLRESKESKIIDFTKYIDSIELNIEKCLLDNNILIIKPNPHDMFDAKEHEVLLAEKNENFLKGQIIKVVNYGYKKKDEVVIKRATIIAAK
ncbi:nucleotide exchange factor GrpE [uncultured Tyzzerella sp.]|uniref:nucleotide exchange factor GrpE n=1 Tax=uncultured Tyzzerella sp. TaxID=2321398 RepID=UPI002943D0BA|nr:nucleotide exchange factor GrpE [uncultured Tyzzerella sp.]